MTWCKAVMPMTKKLGRYELMEKLGRGSMGVVYLARDPLIDRLVAVKAIDLQRLSREERDEYESRFNMEARAAGRLSHPNIVTIYDVGKDGDVVYIAMELLDGQDLEAILLGGSRLTIDEILDISTQVANGLAFAARHGIIHRDIKPSNIMIMQDRRVKIIDFGIAKIAALSSDTIDGKIIGTPLYMSPEQVMNDEVDSRSDIFSLGIVQYQMLTGVTPFAGDNLNAIMYQIVNESPPKPSMGRADVPDMLDPIVLKCLSKNSRARYQSSAELADDLISCRTKLHKAKNALERLQSFKKQEPLLIHQLVYESRPTELLTQEQLRDILVKSQYKNIRLNLSGLLIFHGGRFMQLLEGGKYEVAELFAAIQRDPRHTDIKVVLESDSQVRDMPSWVMGLSADDSLKDICDSMDYYITSGVTIQLCESMRDEVGKKFLRFIGK
jgi:serine/threonine protein kinase